MTTSKCHCWKRIIFHVYVRRSIVTHFAIRLASSGWELPAMMTMSDETGFSIISTIVQPLRNDIEKQMTRFTWKKLTLRIVFRTCQFPNSYFEQTTTCNYGKTIGIQKLDSELLIICYIVVAQLFLSYIMLAW